MRHPNCPYLPLPMLIKAIEQLLKATFLPLGAVQTTPKW